MFCNNCGQENPDDANFCSSCGAVLAPQKGTGETTISFAVPGEAEPEEEFSLALEGLEEDKAILVVKKGPDAGSTFTLDDDVVSVGRDPHSGIFLGDVTVSRKHAEIRRSGHEFRVVDAGSLNGIFVNQERVDQVTLHNGDEIQIGKFKLVFFAGGAAPA